MKYTKKFIFKGEDISYNYCWLDSDTFVFEFGDGKFIDTDGDNYFFHCEYHLSNKKYLFEIWWEDDIKFADINCMSNSEKEEIIQFMQVLMNN